jgi:hypothetical protein
VLNRNGDINIIAKQYRQALISLNISIRIKPDNFHFMTKICSVNEKLEIWSEVVNSGKKLLALYPTCAIGIYNICIYLLLFFFNDFILIINYRSNKVINKSATHLNIFLTQSKNIFKWLQRVLNIVLKIYF